MAEDDRPPAPASGPDSRGPLRAWRLFSLTIATVWRNFGSLCRAAAVPIAALFVLFQGLSWLGVSAAMENAAGTFGLTVVALTTAILHGLLIIAFAVVCHRRVLLGVRPSSVLGVGFGRHEIRYFLYSIFLGLISLVPLMAAGLGVLLAQRLMEEESAVLAAVGLLGLGIILFIVIFVRGGLGLPAMALGRPEGCPERFKISWRQTGGSAVRLSLAMFIINLFVAIIIMMAAVVPSLAGAFWGAESLILLVQLVADFFSAAFVATLLSLAYRQLRGEPPAA